MWGFEWGKISLKFKKEIIIINPLLLKMSEPQCRRTNLVMKVGQGHVEME